MSFSQLQQSPVVIFNIPFQTFQAQYFITCRGFAGAHPGRGSAGRERITRALIDPNVFSGGVEQLSMFSPPAVDRLVEQGVPPRTAQKMVREEAVQCLARAL